MSCFQVNERSTAYITATFKDKTGALAIPSTVTYRIDDVTSGAAIRAPASVTPSSAVEITLTPTDTAIQSEGNISELRRLTIVASYGASDQITADVDYLVTNLRFHPN